MKACAHTHIHTEESTSTAKNTPTHTLALFSAGNYCSNTCMEIKRIFPFHPYNINNKDTHTADILTSLKGLTCFLYLGNKLNVGLDTCRAADVWVIKVRPAD